ncbi:hypothetical protein DW646_22180 [Bacteroides sp. AM23-18]|jgi:co-chaperonin GroES (HSP10)|nr:hypothetical protein DW646_22180 [Bacteroides sp. AM23-18]
MNKKMMNKWIFGVALLLFAACTQDELTEQGDTLPEGVYPLEISSVILEAEVSTQPWGADGPQTRVSENNPDRNSSKWDGNETIYVQLDNTDGIGEFKINKIDEKNITVTPVNTVYWTKRTDDVTAWYPANGEIRLDNQQGGNLAYVLRATAEKASYDSPVSLTFTHQLAKIRVKLAGEKAGSVTDVKIESCTSCTNTNGTVSFDETSVGEITMHKVNENTYEANVVPGKTIERFKVNDGDWVVLSTPVTPEKGKIHEISIDVKKAPLQPGEDGKFTVNAGDDVLIKDYSGPASIVVNGNGTATITLDNVQLTTGGTAMEINNGATVTLNVVGTSNSLASTNGSGIGAHENCNIIIQGESIDNSKLTVSSGEGRNVGIGFIMGQGQGTLSYGNIEISDVTLSVTASSGGSDNEGAAIGVTASVNGGWQSQAVVGNITITNSNVTASSKRGAACIGTSFWENDMQSLTMGVISIENSTVTATNQEVGSWLPACIGMGTVYAGSVTIQKIEIESSTLHLTTNASNKVGKGTVYGTATITEGIIVDGNDKGKDGWNPS